MAEISTSMVEVSGRMAEITTSMAETFEATTSLAEGEQERGWRKHSLISNFSPLEAALILMAPGDTDQQGDAE